MHMACRTNTNACRTNTNACNCIVACRRTPERVQRSWLIACWCKCAALHTTRQQVGGVDHAGRQAQRTRSLPACVWLLPLSPAQHWWLQMQACATTLQQQQQRQAAAGCAAARSAATRATQLPLCRPVHRMRDTATFSRRRQGSEEIADVVGGRGCADGALSRAPRPLPACSSAAAAAPKHTSQAAPGSCHRPRAPCQAAAARARPHVVSTGALQFRASFSQR